MIRTQVSLGRGDYEAAKTEARRLGIPFAELVRRALRGILPVRSKKPWMKYAGMVRSGDAASSRTIDEVVYGHER
ncbi:MAG: CopG family transcriptional regulator [Nitrospirae bacterium]|nr:CopG family transcriptional regulator [Nitrospirota bacterium]